MAMDDWTTIVYVCVNEYEYWIRNMNLMYNYADIPPYALWTV